MSGRDYPELDLYFNSSSASIGASDLTRYIREHFVHGSPLTIPEIALYTAGPRSGLRGIAEQIDNFDTPYWAYAWGGGLALARHLLDHPATVAQKRVLDLGSGSGLVAIAACMAGAAAVTAVDANACAATATALNARSNSVNIVVRCADVAAMSPVDVDVVLAGDMFYDETVASKMIPFLDRCLDKGHLVLVGDPGRSYLPRERLEAIGSYEVPDFAQLCSVQASGSNVFKFRLDCDTETGGHGQDSW